MKRTSGETQQQPQATKIKTEGVNNSEEYVKKVQEQWQEMAAKISQTISNAAQEIQTALQALGESVQKILEEETTEVQAGLQEIVESSSKLVELGEQTKKIRVSISALHRVTEKPLLHVDQNCC